MCLLRVDQMRRVYVTCISAELGLVTSIKQQPLPQLINGHVKWLFLWTIGNFGNRHQKRAHYCELNIRDACCEPTSRLSRQNETHLFSRASAVSRLKETRSVNPRFLYLDERAELWGPPVSIGNMLLHCPLHCWHVCNRHSEWSPLLTDQCL
jgi:hypothetical protein